MQSELDETGVRKPIANGCIAIAEGANMPTTPEGIKQLQQAGVAFGPGKVADAGDVAALALEMQQNVSRDAWSFEYTEQRLREIMHNIHRDGCQTAAAFGQPANDVMGRTSSASGGSRKPCWRSASSSAQLARWLRLFAPVPPEPPKNAT
jgi:glutamate dehydrogenase (NADP+)